MEHVALGSPTDRDMGLEVLCSLESITNRLYHHGELAGHLVLRWQFVVPKTEVSASRPTNCELVWAPMCRDHVELVWSDSNGVKVSRITIQMANPGGPTGNLQRKQSTEVFKSSSVARRLLF